MALLSYCRGLMTLLIAVPLTFLVSVFALIDLAIRKSPAKALMFPRFWGWAICRLAGVHVRIEGLENIQPDKTYIFAGNHASQFDIFAFQGFFPYDFRWIAKKELFRIPIFGQTMRKADFIPIDRSKGRQAMESLNEAARRIASGSSVLIFPEGTRSAEGNLQPFKSGMSLLAIKADVEVVPVAFKGTRAILPKKKLLAKSGQVVIRFGSPVSPGKYDKKDKQQLADHLQHMVADLLAMPEKAPLPGANGRG